MDNLSPIVEISKEMADSLSVLNPTAISENLLISAAYGNTSNNTTEISAPIDANGNLLREWSTAGVLTDTLRSFLKEMKIDSDTDQFSENTKSQLKKLLSEVKTNDQYDKIIFGILGDKKRRKQLSKPIYDFMLENNFTSDQVKIVKVAIGESDDNWIGKNKHYRLRLE